MRLLYHITNLPPKIAGTEASRQELDILRRHFGGDLVHLNPNQQSPIYLPRLLFGFHRLKQIRAAEATVDAHHLYNADPFPFPFVRRLRRPVIYSVSSGVGQKRPNLAYFNSLAAVTVSDQRSLDQMTTWGVRNCFLVRHGIDTEQFSVNPLPLNSDFKIMVGSAPWTRGQFESKGIDALLAALQQAPWLHLVFLWRGVLFETLSERVRQSGLEAQVEIINRRIDVNDVLARVHASIALATDPAIIKAYPHSLLESLAAGKPVLISRSIPMADYIEQHGCGQVVDSVTPKAILAAIETLRQHYSTVQQAATDLGARDFSHQAMVASFESVYEAALEAARKPPKGKQQNFMRTVQTVLSTPNPVTNSIDSLMRWAGNRSHLPPLPLRDVGPSDFEATGREFLDHFIEIGHLQPHERVLDIGCGSGRMALPLTGYLDSTGFYLGMDIVKPSIIWCRQNIASKFPNFRFLHFDLYNQRYNPHGQASAADYVFPLSDHSFDFIFLTSVFTHLLPNSTENYLREIARLLCLKGRVLATVFLLNDEQQRLADLDKNDIDFRYGSGSYRTRSESTPESAVAYSEPYFRELIDTSGLELGGDIHYGTWSGRPDGLSYQDMVLLRPQTAG